METLYSYIKVVNLEKFFTELNAWQTSVNVTVDPDLILVRLDTVGDQVNITLSDALSSETEASLAALVASHNPHTIADAKVKAAAVRGAMCNFGQNLLIEFLAQLATSGATPAQLMALAVQYNMIQVTLYTGNLAASVSYLTSAVPGPIVTQSIIDDYKGRIQTFLGTLS